MSRLQVRWNHQSHQQGQAVSVVQHKHHLAYYINKNALVFQQASYKISLGEPETPTQSLHLTLALPTWTWGPSTSYIFLTRDPVLWALWSNVLVSTEHHGVHGSLPVMVDHHRENAGAEAGNCSLV